MTPDEYLGSLKRKISYWVAKQVEPAPNLKASERNSLTHMTKAKLPAALIATVLALHIKKEAVQEADPWYKPNGRKLDHTLTFPYDSAYLPTSARSHNRCRSPLVVNSGARAAVEDKAFAAVDALQPSPEDIEEFDSARSMQAKRTRDWREKSIEQCCACQANNGTHTYLRTPCGAVLCHACIRDNVAKGNMRMLGIKSIRCPVCESSECALQYNDYVKVRNSALQ